MNDNLKEKLVRKHLECVLKKNQVINLTRITDFHKAEIFHIEDSLSALPEINNAIPGTMIDIGSGAGYPGIPLAIYTKRTNVLIETVGKKAECLQYFLDKLKINDLVTVYNGRIEDYAREHKNSASVITARALSKINSLLELASPLLKQNGLLICYKSDNCDNEIDSSQTIQDKFGMKLNSIRQLTLSDGLTKRQIITYKKIKEPKIKLPRKNGFAQKKPFKK